MSDDPFPPGFEAAIPDSIGDRRYDYMFNSIKEGTYLIDVVDQRSDVFETKTGNLFPEPDHLLPSEKSGLNQMDIRLKAKAEDQWLVEPPVIEDEPPSENGEDEPFPPHDDPPVPVAVGDRKYSTLFGNGSNGTYEIHLIDQFGDVFSPPKTGDLSRHLTAEEKDLLVSIDVRMEQKAVDAWLIC